MILNTIHDVAERVDEVLYRDTGCLAIAVEDLRLRRIRNVEDDCYVSISLLLPVLFNRIGEYVNQLSG